MWARENGKQVKETSKEQERLTIMATKQVYLQTNHCSFRNTYSLYTIENDVRVLHKFDNYAATENPNKALKAAVELRKQGYQLIQMERYREIMDVAARDEQIKIKEEFTRLYLQTLKDR